MTIERNQDGRIRIEFGKRKPKRQLYPIWPPAYLRLPDTIEEIEQGHRRTTKPTKKSPKLGAESLRSSPGGHK